jgi:glycerophosphoryl diester phosphodiesterase
MKTSQTPCTHAGPASGAATRIWAHRGASSDAPENTLPAFDLAIRQQADGIELDVQMSRDGVLVVAHDTDCLRLTGEPGLIAGLDYSDLRRLNFAHGWPDHGFVPAPALAEVFDLIRPAGLMINIELKNDEIAYAGLEEAVLRLIIDWRMQDRVLLSSFNRASLVRTIALIRQKGLDIPCGLLFEHHLSQPWSLACRLGAAAIHPRHTLIRQPSFIAAAHAAGILVHPWTVDGSERLAELMGMGADAVITNRPALACQIRAAVNQSR